MKNIFKLIFALIASMFGTQKIEKGAITIVRDESPNEKIMKRYDIPKYEEGAVTIVRGNAPSEKVDALQVARSYVPKSERIKRIVIKHENREIINTRGNQMDIENFCNMFRVIAKTVMSDEVVLHITQP